MPILNLDKKIFEQHLHKFNERVMSDITSHAGKSGTMYSELFSFCCIGEHYGIDMIVEGGTLIGYSAIILSKYFGDIPIITIDRKVCENVRENIKPYSNIKFKHGNGIKLIPDIVRTHPKNKIGMFLDGPKGVNALPIAEQCFKFGNVLFVAFHDMCKSGLTKNRVMIDNKSRVQFERLNYDQFYTDVDWFVDTYSKPLDVDKFEENGKIVIKEIGSRAFAYGSYGPTMGFIFKEKI